MLLVTFIRGQREEAAFHNLASSVADEIPETNRQEEPAYTAYLSLYEQNEDFAAWLNIPNTKVDYPVMYTPEEPEYYLRRAFDKFSSQSGTPFIGEDGNINSDMFIIYGHNMKNDTMFGTLDKYKDKAFWEDNPTFTLTTIYEERTYEIIAAIQTRVLYQDETGYRFYYQAGSLSEQAFNELTAWIQRSSLYDTGIEPVYGEQIVILSTCSYQTDNGRFIVAARRIDNEIQE